MAGRPAARITDLTAHPPPAPLVPGPGSFNVLIGSLPAWRGLPAGAAAALQSAKATTDATVNTAKAATVAAAGTPGAPAAKAAEETTKATVLASMSTMMSSMASAPNPSGGMPDIMVCSAPVLPVHGVGLVIDGSPTVLINGLPACRMGDTLIEALGPTNKIVMGMMNVLIGDAATVTPSSFTPGGAGPGGAQPGKQGGAATPQKAGPKTGLGDDVDEIAGKSPTLTANIEKLQAEGWTIEYGEAGKGSYCDKDAKRIVIDSNEKGNAAGITQTLAHESGHALYTADPYVGVEGNTRDEYARKNGNSDLKDEGEATLTNAQVRKEINDAGGPDIGIAGANADKYQEIADKYPDAADRDKARQEIADVFADNEHPSTDPDKTYREYYERWHKEQYDEQTKDEKKP